MPAVDGTQRAPVHINKLLPAQTAQKRQTLPLAARRQAYPASEPAVFVPESPGCPHRRGRKSELFRVTGSQPLHRIRAFKAKRRQRRDDLIPERLSPGIQPLLKLTV